MLPTLQFPNVGAYRTDKVAGTQNNLANYWAFIRLGELRGSRR